MAEPAECQACDDTCTTPNWSVEELQWCSIPVATPCTDWESVEEEVAYGAQPDVRVTRALRDIQIYVVKDEDDLPAALDALHHSMQDAVLGIDTEWKPDTKGTQSKTAMISMASSSCVVLVRTCSMGWKVPEKLLEFCKDEQIVGVGLNWDGADELKMLDSFDLGRHELFSHFVDIKHQAEVLGYQHAGLSNLAQRLLRFEPPKSKAVTMSNWESYQLTPRQVRYAALDALLTGDLFRKLRFLHSFPQPCSGCSLPLGSDPVVLDLRCLHEECINKKPHASVVGLLAHASSKNHPPTVQLCNDCGRVSALAEERMPVPTTSKRGAAEASTAAQSLSMAQHVPEQQRPRQMQSNTEAEPHSQEAALDPFIHPSFLRPSADHDEDSRRDVLEQLVTTKLAPQGANQSEGKREQRQTRRSRGGRKQGSSRASRQDREMFAAYNAYT